MSLNKFMHSRNIYKKKRNFAVIAGKYPELEKYLIHFDNGNTTIDFKSASALRCLTRSLLKVDFDLDVDLPEDRLVPAVPQRFNYLLWVEDLVKLVHDNDKEIICLDIGTGASCIIPLLAVRTHNKWKAIATEVDERSFEFAKQNVALNKLESQIRVLKVNYDTPLTEIIGSHNISITFCNPPFYDENGEAIKQTKSNTAASNETKTLGGEFEFVKNMIEESESQNEHVAIFTTMLGKKRDLKQLKRFLRENSINNFVCAEFCQGKVIRWGLAWTFRSDIKLCDAPKLKHIPSCAPMKYVVPFDMKAAEYTLNGVSAYLKTLLNDDLNIISYDVILETVHTVELWVTSDVNNWSNQRRKRRQKKQLQSVSESGDSMDAEEKSTIKRKLDDSDEEVVEVSPSKKLRDVSLEDVYEDDQHEMFLLHCSIVIKQKNKAITLKVTGKEKCRDRETPHQLFQYFKNKLL